MKSIITYFFLLIILSVHGQSPCLNPMADSILISDNLQVPLSSTSDLFLKKGNKGFSMPLREDGKNISLFSSAGLWIGGKDEAGNLKMAATIRDNTNKRDFHPGPLDENGQTTFAECDSYDRVWKVERKDIIKHISMFRKAKSDKRIYSYDSIPLSIKTWPARGNPFYYMDSGIIDSIDIKVKLPDYGANFTDIDDDGFYNPLKGDYPSVNQHDYLPWHIETPEVIYFWVFNGNIRHYATGGDLIQMQVNAYAYKFKSDEEINDCLYFSYHLINKADTDLRDAYVGMFFDPSMGCPLDDKVAFDTLKNTIHFYNGHTSDNKTLACEEPSSLGDYPYSISVDYKNSLRVPKVYAKDNKGNYIYDKDGFHILIDPTPGTGEVDALVKGDVSSFTVFDNCDTEETGDCSIFKSDQAAYNLLRGRNYNGEPILHDELPVKKMFTGNPSEPSSWTMGSDSNFTKKNISCLMSVGPLMLQPGSLNRFDFSVCLNPLIKDVPDFDAVDFNMPNFDSKYYHESIDERGLGLEHTSLKFETLADESKIKVEIEKIDYVENLHEWALPNFKFGDSLGDRGYYKFEGYNVFQVKDPNNKVNDENYKLIMQCDLENEFDRLYNYYPETYTSPDNKVNRRWQRKLMVSGNNKGLQYTVNVDRDYFAKPGEDALIDGKTYYYAVQSYNANNWKTADQVAGYGQREQFWAGRPVVFSHYYTTNKAKEEVRYFCENNTLLLSKLIENDNIKISSIDGQLLANYKYKGSDGNEVIHVQDKTSIVVVEISNPSLQRKMTFKVFCL